MPRVLARPRRAKATSSEPPEATTLMPLKDARDLLEGLTRGTIGTSRSKRRQAPTTALEQVKRHARNVIVGAPGGGKSTFLEWLQVQLASAEEVLVMADQQAIPRGIRSEFTLDEKLRTCREVALAMQADDQAEYRADQVHGILATVLGDEDRATALLEHIRYRTGLLLERRPGVFAFAHLTFQEYLAAWAVHEGNRRGVDVSHLIAEHADGQWKEVIALYCGLATTPAARAVVEGLVAQPDTTALAHVLADAFLSAGAELAQDDSLRRRILERLASAPWSGGAPLLEGIPEQEIAQEVNLRVGTGPSDSPFIAYYWLFKHPHAIEFDTLAERLRGWRTMSAWQILELSYLLHAHALDPLLGEIALDSSMYSALRVRYFGGKPLNDLVVALAATFGLCTRHEDRDNEVGAGYWYALLQILGVLLQEYPISPESRDSILTDGELTSLLEVYQDHKRWLPIDASTWSEFIALAHALAEQLVKQINKRYRARPRGVSGAASNKASSRARIEHSVAALKRWAEALEHEQAASGRMQTKSGSALCVEARAHGLRAAIGEGADH